MKYLYCYYRVIVAGNNVTQCETLFPRLKLEQGNVIVRRLDSAIDPDMLSHSVEKELKFLVSGVGSTSSNVCSAITTTRLKLETRQRNCQMSRIN